MPHPPRHFRRAGKGKREKGGVVRTEDASFELDPRSTHMPNMHDPAEPNLNESGELGS
jgi:hypothetical protein